MPDATPTLLARRSFLSGAALTTAAIALPGCSSMGGYSLVEVVRRLLMLSAQNAFARLTAPGGFWDSQVARFNLPELFGNRGGVVQAILTSGVFRDRLQHQLNILAEKGAYRAAPLVTDAVRTIGIDNAVALIRGEPTAATSFLRERMGPSLINAMIPELGEAIRIGNDPIISQAITALVGVDVGAVAQAVAISADNSIWYQIGAEEAAIRADPKATNDPMLIAALKVL